MEYARKDVEKTKLNAKKFVRYQEGTEKYNLGLIKFQKLAKKAKAVSEIKCITGEEYVSPQTIKMDVVVRYCQPKVSFGISILHDICA